MSLPSELESQLSAYLYGQQELAGFRSWFVPVLQTVNRHEQPARDLVWDVEVAIARFGVGLTSEVAFRAELTAIAEGIAPRDVQAANVVTWLLSLCGPVAKTLASNSLKTLAVVAFAGQRVDIGPALVPAL